MLLVFAVKSFLLFWLLISVTTQYGGRVARYIKSKDFVAIIPTWTFFAPNPNTSDHILLYREKLSQNGFSSWRAVNLCQRIPIISALWNPTKRRQKVLIDTSNALLRVAERTKPEHLHLISLSAPYILLLQVVERQPRSPLCELLQFSIMERKGQTKEKLSVPIFLSGLHNVCD